MSLSILGGEQADRKSGSVVQLQIKNGGTRLCTRRFIPAVCYNDQSLPIWLFERVSIALVYDTPRSLVSAF